MKTHLSFLIPFAVAASLTGQAAMADESISPEIANLDLSGGCKVAQQKAAQYANQFAQQAAATPSVCGSAKANRKIGELTVRVAESCQELPTWTQEKQTGEQMIEQSDQTISGSCQ
ncbi:hypothetical protein [Burkholderia guangdongensis]|uniref:hypothetical protein n=1 Tax=Burkholderia guangdongensis TaxID=1792500 RepID=UPI0015CD0EC7|nr:hypothetical protein [Burkholderia guangdongensis]